MEQLGVQKIPIAQEQYKLYYFNFSHKCDSQMPAYFFPTKVLAEKAFLALQYFLHFWYRGLDGGELWTGLIQGDPIYLGDIPPKAIGFRFFIKMENLLVSNCGNYTIYYPAFVEICTDLNKYKWNGTLGCVHRYDEFTLAVLRYVKLRPRIKRSGWWMWALKPFKHDYVETDESTVRQMGLVGM